MNRYEGVIITSIDIAYDKGDIQFIKYELEVL